VAYAARLKAIRALGVVFSALFLWARHWPRGDRASFTSAKSVVFADCACGVAPLARWARGDRASFTPAKSVVFADCACGVAPLARWARGDRASFTPAKSVVFAGWRR